MKFIYTVFGLCAFLLISPPAQAEIFTGKGTYDYYSAKTSELAEAAREARYRCTRDEGVAALPESSAFVRQLIDDAEQLGLEISAAGDISGKQLKNFSSLVEQVLNALEKSGCDA